MWVGFILLGLSLPSSSAGCSCNPWQASTHYRIGDSCFYGSSAFLCTTEHSSTNSFDNSKWIVDTSDTACCERISSCLCQDWQPSTKYQFGDTCKYNGVNYRCVLGHVSASDVPTFSDIPTYWEQDSGSSCCSSRVMNGCQGWQSFSKYRTGDYVSYRGKSYVCNAEHLSGASFNADLWGEDASGTSCALSQALCVQNCAVWQPSTRYDAGDTCTIGGIPHTCTGSHVSSTQILPDSEKALYWQAESGTGCCNARTSFYQCMPWQPLIWYRTSDYVVYGSKAYTAKIGHISDPSFNVSRWSEDISGTACAISPSGATCEQWKPLVNYQPGDSCLINGQVYTAKAGHVSSNSGNAPPGSELGSFWQGDSGSGCDSPPLPAAQRTCTGWTPSTTYHIGDYCTFGNRAYVAQVEHTSEGNFSASKWIVDPTGTACVVAPFDACTCPNWQSKYGYRSGDARNWNGDHYICTQPHTGSSTFYSGRDGDDRVYWQKDSGTACCPASGTTCSCNAWNANIRYHVGDYVSSGTKRYVCSQEHVSGSSFDAGKWTVDITSTACCSTLAAGKCQCLAWQGSTKYRVGDTRTIGQYPYICKLSHVSDPTPGALIPNSNELSKFWQQDSGTGCCNSTARQQCAPWQAAIHYHIGDYVVSSNRAYVSIVEHFSTNSFDITKWLADDGDSACAVVSSCSGPNNCIGWQPSTRYRIGDTVSSNGNAYICKAAHVSSSSSDLSTDKATYWQQDSGSGCCNSTTKQTCTPWQTSTQYHVGDYVSYNFKAYVCKQDHVSPSSNFDGPNSRWSLDDTDTACARQPACVNNCPAWVPRTKYRIGDSAAINGNPFICKTAHISSGSPVPDSPFWQADSGLACCNATTSSPCLVWQTGMRFHVGDYVSNSNNGYLCQTEHTSTNNFDLTKFIKDTSNYLCRPNQCKCSPWKASVKYAVGDTRVYNGMAYRCKSAHTSSYTFARSYWDFDSGRGCCVIKCPCGSYCTYGSLAPISCKAGYYCPADSSTMIPCPAGSYCPAGSCSPKVCNCGYKCPPRSKAPIACQPPFYCPKPNATSQTLCPTGYSCPNPAMCTPFQCPLGSWVSCAGKVSCDSCTAGRYCPNVTTTLICPPGFFCPESSYQTTPCPAGSYCPIGSPAPRLCPSGFYCPTGASVQISCPSNDATVTGASSCSPKGSRRTLKESAETKLLPSQSESFSASTAHMEQVRVGVSNTDAALYSLGMLLLMVVSASSVRKVMKGPSRSDPLAANGSEHESALATGK